MNEYPMCEVPRIDWMSGEPASARMSGSVTSVSMQLRAARPLRVDDDLRVGDVGDGVERRGAQRVDAQGDQRRDQAPDDASGSRMTCSDDGGDHAVPCARSLFSLYSASMKKLPKVTTCSPAFKPVEHLVYSSPCTPVWISCGT